MAECSSDPKNEHNHTNGNKDNDDDFCDQFRYFVSVEFGFVLIYSIHGKIAQMFSFKQNGIVNAKLFAHLKW